MASARAESRSCVSGGARPLTPGESGGPSRRRAPVRSSPGPPGLVLLLLTAWMVGCSPDVHDGMGPRVPLPNVKGVVLRAGDPAAGLGVDLREPVGNLTTASTHTTSAGEYDFGDVPAGTWEVKVSGDDPGDFDSVTRPFSLAIAGQVVLLPDLDIAAYSAAPSEPAAGALVPTPSPQQPLHFVWQNPARPFLSARVQVFDGRGQAVWYSPKSLNQESLWNGVGNQGDFTGLLVTAGTYGWRVKFELPDTVEARTGTRAVQFQ